MAPEVKIPNEEGFKALAAIFAGLNGEGSGLRKAIDAVSKIKIEAGNLTEANSLETHIGSRATSLKRALDGISAELTTIATRLGSNGSYYQNTENFNKSKSTFTTD